MLVCRHAVRRFALGNSAQHPGNGGERGFVADGHALALRGEAGRAIGIATSGAFCGTLFGVVCLAAFTPTLARVALSFGARSSSGSLSSA